MKQKRRGVLNGAVGMSAMAKLSDGLVPAIARAQEAGGDGVHTIINRLIAQYTEAAGQSFKWHGRGAL